MSSPYKENTLLVSPRLRVVSNGRLSVNTARAELTAAIRITSQSAADELSIDEVRGEEPRCVSTSELLKSARKKTLKAARGKQAKELPKNVEVNVFITLADDTDLTKKKRPFPKTHVSNFSQSGRSATATVRLNALPRLAADPRVSYLSLGETLRHPAPVLGQHASKPATEAKETAKPKKGKHRVLVGVIDVGGFDFAHREFVWGGETRFVRIWDQGADGDKPSRFDFDYGHEITRQQMNDAIREAKQVGVGVHDLEPQSQQSRHSHATHVASIAAGRLSGVARGFDVAGVLLSLPESALERRLSFYDSTRLVHAIDYLIKLSDGLDYDAVSINISLGTNGHAHDGSAPVCRWIDSALTKAGRAISVSAGNSGQQEAQYEGDWGFVMGRIHTCGHIASRGLQQTIEWEVVGNGIEDVSENELQFWYEPQDRFAIQLKPPNGDWLPVVEPGEYLENQMLPDGSFYSIYNDLYHEDNGHNTLSVYLSPFLSRVVKGIPAGTWLVRLIGRDVRNGHFDAWIERDDPRPVGKVGDREFWRFPSFFSEKSNVDHMSINSLACAHNVIGVANLDAATGRINITSSQGPTRDRRSKPDIAASGTDVRAASGFDPAEEYIEMTGTSMASPHVAGAVAMMLSHEPQLTAAQILGVLRRTAQPLSGTDYEWQDDAGYGVIQVQKCIDEASQVRRRRDLMK